MLEIKIRRYSPNDYGSVTRICKQTGWFDKVTDSEPGLKSKIKRDKDSILVAIVDNKIVGTVSIIEDGRIAWLFRLLAQKGGKEEEIRNRLMKGAEIILKKKGYKNVHIFSIDSDTALHKQYREQGYSEGNVYAWFWKAI